MGQIVYIQAKKEANIKRLNAVLTKMGIENDFTTEQHNINWLWDINFNPGSPQRHLKPADRDLTMEELLRTFPSYTTVGLLTFDVAFSRTTEEQAQQYLEFIRKYKNQLEYLKGAEELLERYNCTADQRKVIKLLNVIPEPPKKLPEDQQHIPDLQSGLYLCKSWGLQPFWLVFGNCPNDHPVFLKTRIYEEDIYNDIYRDKNGLAYLLIPLLPLNNRQLEFVEKVYTDCTNMGLREDFNFIIPLIYGLDVTNYMRVASQYHENYSNEELQERLKTVFKLTDNVYKYGEHRGFRWSDAKKQFVTIPNDSLIILKAKCSVMTCLVWAMGEKLAAQTMTEITGKPYRDFEFDIRNVRQTPLEL
jgi:hypothetical protein